MGQYEKWSNHCSISFWFTYRPTSKYGAIWKVGQPMICLHLEPDWSLSMPRNSHGWYLFHSNWENENKIKFCFWFSCRLTSKIWVAPENGKYGNMKSEATLLHFSHRLICSDCLGFWENQLLVSPCCPMLPEQINLVAPYCLILSPPLDKEFSNSLLLAVSKGGKVPVLNF